MLKSKKKIVLTSIFATIICLIFLFSKPIFSYSIKAVLKIATRNSIGASIKFKNFELKKRKIVLNQVKIKHKKSFEIKLDQLDIGLEFKLFRPRIIADIYLDEPKVTIYKNQKLDLNFSSRKENSFVTYFLNINKAKLDFVDDTTIVKTIVFDFFNHFKTVSKLDLYFDENVNKKLTIDINKIANIADFSCHFDQLDTSHLGDVLEFFNIDFFQNIKGFATGILVFNIEQNKITKFFTNLDLLNFSFVNKLTNLNFDFKTLRLEMSFPDFLCKNENILLDLIKYDFLKNSKIRLNFDDLRVLTAKKSSFSNINGFFSYNPNLGSKIDIQGQIENEKIFDFQINSKAYIASSFSNWLDLNLLLDKDKTQISFQAKQIDDYYNLHLSFANIRSHIFRAFQDLLIKPIHELDDFSFNKGNLSFCLDSRFNKKGIDKVFVTDLTCRDFDFQKENIKGFITNIEAKSSFDFSKKNIFEKFFTDLKITDAFFDLGNKKIKDLNAKIFVLDSVLQSSHISCDLNGIKTLADFKGPILEFDVILNLDGKIKEFYDSFSSTISCKRKNNDFLFYGNFQIADGQEAVFGFNLDKLLIYNIKDFQKHLTKAWIRAEKVILKKWPKILDQDILIDGLANIAAFYDKDKFSIQIKGENLIYKNPYIDLRVDKIGNINDFVFEKDNFIKASFKKDLLTCDIPTFKGKCFLPKFDLLLDLNETKIAVDKNVLKAKVKSLSENVDLRGDVCFDFSKKYSLLTIDIKDIQADIASMQNLLKHFDYSKTKLNLLGFLKGNSKIITSFEDDLKTYYKVNFDLFDGSYKLNENTSFKDLKCFIRHNSNKDITISNLQANLNLKDERYRLVLPSLTKTKEKIDFDLRLEKDLFDLFRFKGNFNKKQNIYALNIDKENSHFFSHQFKDLNISIDNNFDLNSFNAKIKLNSFATLSGLQFLLNSKMSPINLFSYIHSKHAGDLDISFLLNENKEVLFDITSKNLKIFDKKFDEFIVQGKKSKNILEVQRCLLDDFLASLTLNAQEDVLQIDEFILKKKDELFLKMQGFYNLKDLFLNTRVSDIKIDLKKLNPLLNHFVKLPSFAMEGHLKGEGSCKMNLPLNKNYSLDFNFLPSNLTIQKVRLYNNGQINANFSDKGLGIQGLDLSFYSKDIDLSYLCCKIGNVSYNFNNNNWNFKESNIYIPKTLTNSFEKIDRFQGVLKEINFDDDIDINCDVEISSDLSNIKLSAKGAKFSINSKKHDLRDIFLEIKDKNSFLGFDYRIKNNYYKIENDIIFDNIFRTKTLFLEKQEIIKNPLTIFWNIDEEKKLKVKEVVGSFCGVDFMLQENVENINSNQLFGSIKIDNSKLKKILPKQLEESFSRYNIGNGYEVSGLLNLDFSKNNNFSFEGLFSGKDFEMLGYQFKTMFSKIMMNSNLIKLTDFKISDQSGIVTINELLFEKNKDLWQLNIPFLKIKDLRPSLMQKINEPLEEITPFLIRELVLNDFKGNLNSKQSFTGTGYFYFINSFKRGYSVFDFPADVLSRIVGIDQELLTPVTGKMQFFVKDAKFNFSNLKDSFSEAQRSKFFLLDKGRRPYVDFDGNIYLNIAMKQYVLFKFTESFVISIRGNLEDPECNLKKKRGFFN